MTKTIVQFILLFLALMVLQLVCNKIILFNVAMPVVFIYLILRLPVNLHTGWVLTIAFVTGLVIDIFNNTPGIPSVDSMGVGDYFKYMATIVTIYCALVFLIQAFTLHNILLTLARIAASSVLSIIIIFGLDTLVSTRREKRL